MLSLSILFFWLLLIVVDLDDPIYYLTLTVWLSILTLFIWFQVDRLQVFPNVSNFYLLFRMQNLINFDWNFWSWVVIFRWRGLNLIIALVYWVRRLFSSGGWNMRSIWFWFWAARKVFGEPDADFCKYRKFFTLRWLMGKFLFWDPPVVEAAFVIFKSLVFICYHNLSKFDFVYPVVNAISTAKRIVNEVKAS